MGINRKRPTPGCDLALWLSGTINDAIRDAREAGLDQDAIWHLLSIYARDADPQGLRRLHELTGELGAMSVVDGEVVRDSAGDIVREQQPLTNDEYVIAFENDPFGGALG